MKIIVVENEQRAREGIIRLIGMLSPEYEIVARASNGETGLELIVQLEPDVVFTDIKMPYMNGVELIRAVRSRGLRTEFVVVSAYADFKMAQQCISLDVADYLLKPLTRSDMETALSRIQARLDGRRVYPAAEPDSLRKQYPDAHPLVLRALDAIQSGYGGKISQKGLAQQLGISPEYFSYLFSIHVGEPFSYFLRRYRIQQALLLYRRKDVDRKSVPYAVGFSDPKYFNRVFREFTGKTPSEYLREQDKS